MSDKIELELKIGAKVNPNAIYSVQKSVLDILEQRDQSKSPSLKKMVADILKFVSFGLLDITVNTSKIFTIDNQKIAQEFTEFSQLDALRKFGADNYKLALKFINYYQLEALKILGEDNVDLALKFVTHQQLNALRKFGVDNAELALKFDLNPQIQALEVLGEGKEDQALKVDSYDKLDKLREGVFPEFSEDEGDNTNFVLSDQSDYIGKISDDTQDL